MHSAQTSPEPATAARSHEVATRGLQRQIAFIATSQADLTPRLPRHPRSARATAASETLMRRGR